MKPIYSLIISLLLGICSLMAAGIAERADSAYLAEDYTAALEQYRQAVSQQGPSTDLYYNIGNTYYRLGQPGRAIVNYERALRLDPTNSDAKANLEFVNSRIVDKPSGKGSVFTKITDTLCSWFTPNTWAWIALTLFVIALGATALYIYANKVSLRKVGFFGGISMLGLSAFALLISWLGASHALTDNEAVIVVDASQLSTQPRLPRDGSEEAALLHEGTKITILDSLPSPNDTVNPMWYDVQFKGDNRAWVSIRDIERI